MRGQLTGYQLVTHFSGRFRYENQVVIQKKLKPCRILIVDMPRYQVFHLTRSDLGDISLPKKSFFWVKSITPMYLLFKIAGESQQSLMWVKKPGPLGLTRHRRYKQITYFRVGELLNIGCLPVPRQSDWRGPVFARPGT